MNNELPNQKQLIQPNFDHRLSNRPQLHRRFSDILDMVDQAVAEGCTAHEAEARAVEQVRKLGNEVLSDWAEKSEAAAVAKAREQNPKLRPYRKKNS